MKRIIIILMILIAGMGSTKLKAQALSGIYSIPGSYSSLRAAITDLNIHGISSTTTFNIASGYIETETASINIGSTILNASLSQNSQLIFQKSGSGNNPKIIAYSGTITNNSIGGLGDNMIAINGCDFITFDGIDLVENTLNTTNTSQMEHGYAFFKLNANAPIDGCQHNTIKNCTIKLSQLNQFSIGILFEGSTLSSTTNTFPVTQADANSHNNIYANTIQNVYSGIYFVGFNDTSTTPNYLLYDEGNDVGGDTILEGNFIQSWGCDSTHNTITTKINSYAIIAFNQLNFNASNNTIDSIQNIVPKQIGTNWGSRIGVAIINEGLDIAMPNNIIISNNNIHLKQSFSNIDSMISIMVSGYQGGITCNNNKIKIFPKNNSQTHFRGIILKPSYKYYQGFIPKGEDLNVINNSCLGTDTINGSFSFLTLSIVGDKNFIDKNTISNFYSKSFNGSVFSNEASPAFASDTLRFTENIISNCHYILGNLYSCCFLKYKYTSGSSHHELYIKNHCTNITAASAFLIRGCGDSITLSENEINNSFLSNGLSIGGSNTTVYTSITKNKIHHSIVNRVGISIVLYGAYSDVSKNKITDLNSTSGVLTGIYVNYGSVIRQDHFISNNIIGKFNTPNSTSYEGQIGLYLEHYAYRTISNNTIILNGKVNNPTYGSAGIKFRGTYPALPIFKNNLVINNTENSGINATGLICALKSDANGPGYPYSDSSNNNIWYAGNPSSHHILFYNATTSLAIQNLSTWQSLAFPKESNSKTGNPLLFTNNSSAQNYLHVNNFTNNLAESNGTILNNLVDDIDGNIRFGNPGYTGTGTAPDIGASEFNTTNLPIKVFAGNDTFLCAGSSASLGLNPVVTGGLGIYKYKWTPTSFLNNDTIANPITTPTLSTTYILTVVDSISTLSISDTVQIKTSNSILTFTTCNNQPYNFNGLVLTNAGTYYDTLTSVLGCDSIVTLELKFGNPYSISINDTICQGNSYTIGYNQYFNPGIYIDTFINYTGCDSIITLNLSVLLSSTSTVSQRICSGNFFAFNGQYLTVSGTYYDTLQSFNGCDSVVILNLNVLNPITNIQDTFCNTGSYFFNNRTITSSGIYYDTLQNYLGCDSIIALNLSVTNCGCVINNFSVMSSPSSLGQVILNATSSGTFITPSGTNQPFSLNWVYQNATGFHGTVQNFNSIIHNLPYSTGPLGTSNCYQYSGVCASNLNVVYSPMICVTICGGKPTAGNLKFSKKSICPKEIDTISLQNNLTQPFGIGYQWYKNNTILPSDTNSILIDSSLTNSSNYFCIVTCLTTGNSDTSNIDTINILSTTSSISKSICSGSSFTFNGQSLNTGGTYYDTLVNYFGCDSIIILTLSVNSSSTSSISQSICSNNSFTFNGQSLNSSGFYNDTIINYLGCDSIITLNLSVLLPSTSTTSQSICSGSSIIFNGQSLGTSGSYYDTLINYLGCDSIITLTLIVNSNPVGALAVTSQSCLQPTLCVACIAAANGGTPPYNLTVNSSHGGVYSSSNKTICYTTSKQDSVTLLVFDANGCLSTTIDTIHLAKDCVWPGDANSDLIANNLDIFPIGLLNGVVGPTRTNASLIWIDQPASSFGVLSNGIDAKHADCNGDGIIDGNDTMAILHNYGLTHLRQKSGNDFISTTIGPDTLYQNTTANIAVNLGSAALPLDSVYGVAFSFHVDPTAIDTNSISINLPTSWLFANATDHFKLFKISKSDTRVDVGLVRNNHIAKSGYGTIVNITIDITTGNIIGREDALAAYNKKYRLHYSIDNIYLLKINNEITAGNVAQDSALILYTKPDGIETIHALNLTQSLSPNPANNLVSLKLKGYNLTDEKTVIILDATGRVLMQQAFTGNQTNINIAELYQGIYVVKVISKNGITESKLIKQ